jgi:hypothetical protein
MDGPAPPPGTARRPAATVGPSNENLTASQNSLMPPFPPLEPYATGLLDVGQGQRLYWDACGKTR